MKRKFKIDFQKEKRRYRNTLLVCGIICLLFLPVGLFLFGWMAGILSLFILVQYKLTAKYFIHEYEINENKLILHYSETGVKKKVELFHGQYKLEKDFTVLYGRPGSKMTISWNEGSIYQYWIGDWDEHKMDELLKAKKQFH